MKSLRIISILSISALLAACAGTSTPPAVGVWDVSLNTPIGAQEAVLTIAPDGSGSFSGDQGEQAFTGAVFEGNTFSYTTTIEAQGQSLTLDVSGTVEGDSLDGEFNTPFGPFPLTGTRR